MKKRQGRGKVKELTILEPGQRLKEARKKLGLKQDDLAGENMSKNYISMFENGKRRISIINAAYFADILNNKAEEKGIKLNVTASYFVKNEKDIAREKCIDWIDKILDKEADKIQNEEKKNMIQKFLNPCNGKSNAFITCYLDAAKWRARNRETGLNQEERVNE